MRVGILGLGLMGSKLGTIFARAGHEVVFSYARSTEKLKKLARGVHGEGHGSARVGTPSEAAQEAEALLLAVHWSRIEGVLNQTGDLSGKVIVSCSLPMNDRSRCSSPSSRTKEKEARNWLTGSSGAVARLSRRVPKRHCRALLDTRATAPASGLDSQVEKFRNGTQENWLTALRQRTGRLFYRRRTH